MLMPQQWLCSWSNKQDVDTGGLQATRWSWGHQGQGTHLCPLDGVRRSLGHTRQRGGGWTWLSWPWVSLCCAVITQVGGKGTDPPMRDRMETHSWLPIHVVPVAAVMLDSCSPAVP